MYRKLVAGLFAAALVALPQTLPPGVQKKPPRWRASPNTLPQRTASCCFRTIQPKMTVNMTYLVGSRYEGYGETGMAHLLEHMNFIQTKTRPTSRRN